MCNTYLQHLVLHFIFNLFSIILIFLFHCYCRYHRHLLALLLTFKGKDWKWGGCSDNVGFGEKISKQYIDELETGKDERAIVNLHNNEAGRRVSSRLVII